MKNVMKSLAVLICLLNAIASWAFSSFSLSVNDTIWVNPNKMANGKTIHAHAQFDARVDSWDLTFTYPTGMTVTSVLETSDMRIPYVNCDGDTAILMVGLFTNAPLYTLVSASISEPGYWIKNGMLESYGTVKWEPGYYDRMFDLKFYIASGFTGGNVFMSGHIRCSHDDRGNESDPLAYSKNIPVVIGQKRGDVNGDDFVTVDDMTALINYLLEPNSELDQYELAAADFNCDGYVTIDDVAAIINYLLTQ